MQFEKEEFAQWRNSDVYTEFVKNIKEAMADRADEILNRQYSDSERDMYVRGVLAGYASVLEWQPDFKKPEEENDEEA